MTSFSDAVLIVAEMIALLLAVTFAVTLVQRRFGDEAIRRWMGGPPAVAAMKGTALGVITPFCTYSAIPVLIGMRQAGVRPAGYCAFLFAAPVVDPVMIGVLALVVGPAGAALYVIIALSAALLLAVIVEAFGVVRHLKPVPVGTPAPLQPVGASSMPTEVGGCSSTNTGDWAGWRPESRAAARRAVEMFRSMWWLMAAGVGIGLAIGIFVPPGAITGIAGAQNPLSVPIAAATGVPLYIGTEMFIPIGEALRGAGASSGALVGLIIAGAGANIPEFALLTKVAKARLVLGFFVYVYLVATVAGVITNFAL